MSAFMRATKPAIQERSLNGRAVIASYRFGVTEYRSTTQFADIRPSSTQVLRTHCRRRCRDVRDGEALLASEARLRNRSTIAAEPCLPVPAYTEMAPPGTVWNTWE
jgi:hypothetical protein